MESREVFTFNFDEMWETLVGPYRQAAIKRARYIAGGSVDKFGRREGSQHRAIARFRAAFGTEPAVVMPDKDGLFVACS